LEAFLERVGRLPQVACIALLVGCNDASSPARVELEVLTWWQEDSEKGAFAAVEEHLDDHIRVVQNRGQSATLARSDLTQFMLMKRPPSSFQANLGADVLRWSIVDLYPPSGPCCTRETYLEPIDELLTDSRLLENVEDEIKDHLGLDGAYYAVPLNIHRLNLLFFNRALLPDAETSITIDTLCPADPTSGAPAHDIAIGYDDGFSLAQLTFEILLPSLYGPEFYTQLFVTGRVESDWREKMRHVLECVKYLSRRFLRGSSMRWPDAVRAVKEGRAAFTLTGDWAIGALESPSYPADVGSMVVPHRGRQATFVYTADTFPLPLGAPRRDATLTLLQIMTRSDVQVAFSKTKGSMPARRDARQAPEFDTPTRRDFEDGSIVKLLATSGLLPPYYPIAEINAKLREMALKKSRDDTLESVLDAIDIAKDSIPRWREELRSPPGGSASSP
jgi:glucose/mannose transport system substrate-binding protein